jgi:hypothetical protein
MIPRRKVGQTNVLNDLPVTHFRHPLLFTTKENPKNKLEIYIFHRIIYKSVKWSYYDGPKMIGCPQAAEEKP